MGLDASCVRRMSLWHFLYMVEGWNASHRDPNKTDPRELPSLEESDEDVARLYALGIIKD